MALPNDWGVTVILVAEDSFLVSEAIRQVVEDAGYTVVVVGSAAEALRATGAELPKAAIVDLKLLDGMTGASLGTTLAQRGVPVIVCTGYSDGAAQRRGLGFCHAVLSKPVKDGDLLIALESALGHRLAS